MLYTVFYTRDANGRLSGLAAVSHTKPVSLQGLVATIERLLGTETADPR
ncbi:MAG: hypothetical protein HGA45_16510 [Chloroflexales bacterium]|nr:hypothetical protein [Chloroflexales bacterium]